MATKAPDLFDETEPTAIVPAAPTALATIDDSFTGFENLDANDFVLPIWKVIQPGSKVATENVAGQFVRSVPDTDGKEYVRKTLRGVIMRVDGVRTYFADGSLLCSSKDGKRPAGGENPDGQAVGCGQCQYGRFSKAPTGGSVPPPCKEGYEIVLWQDGRLTLFRVGVSALRDTRVFLSTLNERGVLFATEVEWTTEKITPTKAGIGPYYVPRGHIVGDVADLAAMRAKALHVRELREHLVGDDEVVTTTNEHDDQW